MRWLRFGTWTAWCAHGPLYAWTRCANKEAGGGHEPVCYQDGGGAWIWCANCGGWMDFVCLQGEERGEMHGLGVTPGGG